MPLLNLINKYMKQNIRSIKINLKNIKINIKNIRNEIVSPALRYNNIKIDKDIIFRENINKSSIYRLVNNINNKSYINYYTNLSNNFNVYYSLRELKEKKGSIIIYRSLLKYGHSNFSLEILEYCEPNVLRLRAEYYINLLKPEYNMLKKS